jgi:hypothetical protein
MASRKLRAVNAQVTHRNGNLLKRHRVTNGEIAIDGRARHLKGGIDYVSISHAVAVVVGQRGDEPYAPSRLKVALRAICHPCDFGISFASLKAE